MESLSHLAPSLRKILSETEKREERERGREKETIVGRGREIGKETETETGIVIEKGIEKN